MKGKFFFYWIINPLLFCATYRKFRGNLIPWPPMSGTRYVMLVVLNKSFLGFNPSSFPLFLCFSPSGVFSCAIIVFLVVFCYRTQFSIQFGWFWALKYLCFWSKALFSRLVGVRECICSILQLLCFSRSNTVILVVMHFTGIAKIVFSGASTGVLLPMLVTMLS